mgnify:CR=1 FL=1
MSSTNPIRQFSQGRSEIHKIHPRHLTPEPGFNERSDFGDIERLAKSIEQLGVQQTLRIRKIKGEETLYIVDGERRYKACMLIIEQGKDPGPIPCKLEAQNTTDAERLVHQVTLNSGKEFTLLEKSRVYKRLKDEHGMNGSEIAEALQTTKQSVSNGLTIVTHGSPKLIVMIERGQLAATTALKIIKLHKDNHAYQETKAMDTLSETGRSHITPKDLKKNKPETPEDPATADDASDDDTAGENTSEDDTTGENTSEETTAHDTSKPLDWSSSRDSSGGGGSAGGGGGTGERNVNIEKRFERIDKMLEELNPDNVIPDRQTTVELVINTLNGTHANINSLKDHLLGRE